MKTSIILREFQDPDSNAHIELRIVRGQGSGAQEAVLQLEFEDVRFLTYLLVGLLRGKGIQIANISNWPKSQ